MRTDEAGNQCPATLGEYRRICAAIGGPECPAVTWLDGEIAKHPAGADEEVLAPDSQMRALLMPMLVEPNDLARAVLESVKPEPTP